MLFSLDNVVCADVVCFDLENNLSGSTKSLIELTEKVGLNRITDENVNEWHYRLSILEELGAQVPAKDDVDRHVGLLTGAKNAKRDIWVKEFNKNGR